MQGHAPRRLADEDRGGADHGLNGSDLITRGMRFGRAILAFKLQMRTRDRPFERLRLTFE